MNSLPSFSGFSVGTAQRAGSLILEGAGIENPVVEARLLLGFVLGGGPERVLADRDNILTDEQADKLTNGLERRCRCEPMSQIMGEREFWSMPFKVTSATLTPRPDTETLIEALIDHVDVAPNRILDLGTGTGCIIMALLSHWEKAQGFAIDASADALAVAQENADQLGFADRSTLATGDWTKPGWTDAWNEPFDVVVSNPPYIPANDIARLDVDVKDYEPLSALAGGDDGLDAYRAIVAGLQRLLVPGGWICFEVGIDQADDVASLLTDAGYKLLDKRKDLGGIERAVIARKS
ncbi:peptide chain release factor N(5)-glutamine methyltransferase [Magnetovibrio sp. PR-2]|uniref:peptide chain release factor N(5)-glutamine methyltransferase n=1 Tax=Magnetovibrio sp. PR-2 TaxID=3120356 RepID=UPI002FCE56F1